MYYASHYIHWNQRKFGDVIGQPDSPALSPGAIVNINMDWKPRQETNCREQQQHTCTFILRSKYHLICEKAHTTK